MAMATASSIPVNTTPMESDKEEKSLLSGITTGLSGITSGLTEKYNSFLAPKSPSVGGSSCGSYDKKRSSRKRKGGADFAKYMKKMSAMAQEGMSTAQQGMSAAQKQAESMNIDKHMGSMSTMAQQGMSAAQKQAESMNIDSMSTMAKQGMSAAQDQAKSMNIDKHMENMSAMAKQGMSAAQDQAKSMMPSKGGRRRKSMKKGKKHHKKSMKKGKKHHKKSTKKGKKHHKKSMKKGKKHHKKSMKKGKKHHKKSMKKGKKSRMRGGDPVLGKVRLELEDPRTGTYEFNGDMRFKGSPPMVPQMSRDEEE
jgi:hypothetical protein